MRLLEIYDSWYESISVIIDSCRVHSSMLNRRV